MQKSAKQLDDYVLEHKELPNNEFAVDLFKKQNYYPQYSIDYLITEDRMSEIINNYDIKNHSFKLKKFDNDSWDNIIKNFFKHKFKLRSFIEGFENYSLSSLAIALVMGWSLNEVINLDIDGCYKFLALLTLSWKIKISTIDIPKCIQTYLIIESQFYDGLREAFIEYAEINFKERLKILKEEGTLFLNRGLPPKGMTREEYTTIHW